LAHSSGMTLVGSDAEAMCAPARAALDFLDGLSLSPEARAMAEAARDSRFQCERCGKTTRLYCSRCLCTALPLPPPMRLGVQVRIWRHPKEHPAKSSAEPLQMLAPGDVEVLEWTAAAAAAAAQEPPQDGTWLVFPREDAVDTTEVDWRGVSRLVLIDSRWGHAGGMASSPGLRELPALRLPTHEGAAASRFWRTATERLGDRVCEGLVSTAECLHLVLKHRADGLQAAGEEPSGCLDDLLLLFGLRLRLVVEDYAQDPSKCCPWCTEASRRKAVHDGNARKAAARAAAAAAAAAADPTPQAP